MAELREKGKKVVSPAQASEYFILCDQLQGKQLEIAIPVTSA